MKRFFQAVLATTVLFTAASCDKPEDKPGQKPGEEPIVIQEDTSGYGKIFFTNTDIERYSVWVDNKMVLYNMKKDTTIFIDSIKAGMRMLYAEQQSGVPFGQLAKKKEERVKILTDSIYTWRFP